MASRFVQLKARHYKEVPSNDSIVVYHLLSTLVTDVTGPRPMSPSSSPSSSSGSGAAHHLRPAFVAAVNAIVAPFAFSDVPGVQRLSSKGVESVLSYGSLYASPAPLLSLMKVLLTKVEADATVLSSSILDLFSAVLSPASLSKLSIATLSALLSSLFSWLTAAGYDLHLRFHAFPNLELALASQRSGWPLAGQQQLIERLHEQVEAAGGEESLLTLFQPSQVVFDADAEVELSLLPRASVALPALRLRFTFLRKFNSLFSQLLPLIDLRLTDRRLVLHLRAGARVQVVHLLVVQDGLHPADPLLLRRGLQAAAHHRQPPRPLSAQAARRLHRLRQALAVGNGFRQLYDLPAASLRPPRPHGTEPFLGFEVEFQQEQVVGEGGPYRQYFSDVGRELVDQSPQSASPLFINCPNKQSQVGENRDKFVIAPAATSSLHLQMFEFVGLLFGLCIRTGVRLPIDLPSFVWKPLVGDELTADDLYAIDLSTCEYLKLIDSAEAETLQREIHQSFTTALSTSPSWS